MTERDEASPRHDSCFPVTEKVAREAVETFKIFPRTLRTIHGIHLTDTKQIFSAIIALRLRHGFSEREIIDGAAFTRFILKNQAKNYGIPHQEITNIDALRAYIRDTQEKLGNNIQLEDDIKQFKQDLSASDPCFLEALEELARERNYNDAFFVSAYDYYYTSKNAYETEKIRRMFQIDTNLSES